MTEKIALRSLFRINLEDDFAFVAIIISLELIKENYVYQSNSVKSSTKFLNLLPCSRSPSRSLSWCSRSRFPGVLALAPAPFPGVLFKEEIMCKG